LDNAPTFPADNFFAFCDRLCTPGCENGGVELSHWTDTTGLAGEIVLTALGSKACDRSAKEIKFYYEYAYN